MKFKPDYSKMSKIGKEELIEMLQSSALSTKTPK